jgi:hypothetical protein
MLRNEKQTLNDGGLMASEDIFRASNVEVEAQTIFRESLIAHDVDHS